MSTESSATEHSPLADEIDRNTDPAAVDLTEFGLAEQDADVLLDLAESAIRACLLSGRSPEPDVASLPQSLQRRRGAFVTLHVAGELNGCIGNIDGTTSLAVDVPDLAVKAAVDDPRLPALRNDDLAALSIEISLLSPTKGVPARTRSELFRHLRANEHGLIVEFGRHRAVLLPDVWTQLPDPDTFVDQLLRKAGIPNDPWPFDLIAAVFTTVALHRRLDRQPPSDL